MLDGVDLVLTGTSSNLDRLGHPELPQDAETVAIFRLERKANDGYTGHFKGTSTGNKAPETHLKEMSLFLLAYI